MNASGVCEGSGIADGACDCDGTLPEDNFDCDGNCIVDIIAQVYVVVMLL